MKTIHHFSPIYIVFILITFSFACEPTSVTEDIDDSFLGYEYYPISIGNEWTYKVDSFLYAGGGVYKDTASWFVKEKITKAHEVGGEKNVFVLERSKSKDNINYEISDVWTIKKTVNSIEKTEENHTFIKLIFPPKVGKRWEGNAFIDVTDTVAVFGEQFKMFNNWSYKIIENLEKVTIEGQVFNDVLQVREVADSSAIDIRKSYTHYAKNIGLILEQRSVLFDQSTNDGNKPWAVRADKGFILSRKLLSYNIK